MNSVLSLRSGNIMRTIVKNEISFLHLLFTRLFSLNIFSVISKCIVISDRTATTIFRYVHKGALSNYVDRNLPFFDPPPPCVDSFYTLSVDKNRHFLTPSSCPRTLVNRIDMHARLLILRKKSPLHGLILVCTFIDFEKKFSPSTSIPSCNLVLFWSARLSILRKNSSLHGLILVCTFIDFEKKFPPARLFRTACLFGTLE